MSVGILLDLSGSLGPPGKKDASAFRRKLSDAITHFLTISNSDNDYFAGTFSNRVAFSQTWTGAADSIFEKLGAPENYGQTALYDALYHGIQHVTKGRHSRRVILMVTDGHDNHSKRTFKEVVSLVKRSDVTVYALAVYDEATRESSFGAEGLGVLDDLTKPSGGRSILLKQNASAEAVKTAFQIIADNLQRHYRLSIENETVAGPEKWRKLKLKLDLPDEKGRPKLFTWSRPGFYQ